MKARFITVEGGEGAGKSTILSALEEQLEGARIPTFLTREPGGTRVGELLRDILLDRTHGTLVAEAELLLIFAARVQHLHEVITPALTRGQWVICDRFTDATYAYQGYGRGLELKRIAWLEEWLQVELRPDLTLLLDVPVDTGLQRAIKTTGPDRFEGQGGDFLERVRAGYLARAQAEPERFRVLDAGREQLQVRAALRAVIADYLHTLE